MGGHGGLNILPQKRWNVYNYDNREKVRQDEEAAAKEEQLKREQSRKRDAEFRLEKLRQARGLSTASASVPNQAVGEVTTPPSSSVELKSENDSKHINLFEGIRIFDPIVEVRDEKKEKEKEKYKNKRMKKEAPPRVVTAEDEKYRLGYGVAGKGVKLPWYMAKLHSDDADEKRDFDGDGDGDSDCELEFGRRRSHNGSGGSNEAKKKKTLQELREERLKRERKESEREKALLMDKSRKDRGFSMRR